MNADVVHLVVRSLCFAGGIYFGEVASTDGATLILASDPWPVSSMNWGGYAGGSIVIINGTGAGQWRRIVSPGVNSTLGDGNRTWVLDAPFTVDPLPNDSLIQILPFRGCVSSPVRHHSSNNKTSLFV